MLAHTTTTLPIPILLLFLPPALSQTVTITIGPAAPTSAPEFVDGPTFTSAILNSTNTYRSLYGNAAPLRWNATLEAYASQYLAEPGACPSFAHSGGPYGENLALGCADATSCVDAWGGEAAAYDFARPRFAENTGHFSQLVWRNTSHVGCGRRLCADGGETPAAWFLACEYWPRGNVVGAFAEMVGAPESAGARGTRARVGWVVVGAAVWFCGVVCSGVVVMME
ncbi:PR-1-like protein [Biscogniauxia mediterranea]|nr:PR-1-like protein [Biscogniauxia mediterranea]